MKKLLLGAAAALAIAAPGVASAQSGYVDLGYASTEGDVLGTDFEGDGWQVGGAAAWTNFQVDGSFSSGEEVDTWNIGGHLFSRTDSYLFGGFANYGNSEPEGGTDSSIWTVGLETQFRRRRRRRDANRSRPRHHPLRHRQLLDRRQFGLRPDRSGRVRHRRVHVRH
jgi:opacity protein-like surface antigen